MCTRYPALLSRLGALLCGCLLQPAVLSCSIEDHACWWRVSARREKCSIVRILRFVPTPLLVLAAGTEPLLSSRRVLVLEGSTTPPARVGRESPFSNRVCSVSNGSVDLLKSGSEECGVR